ncbi:hypothetical protein I7860_07210 [Pseudomonas tolaasii]|uniref:hypothetical protein n=1 Tax=Pseudomonas tolaasii TaxID=29442 RepID=UPI001C5620E4|nr:hypothetical protein [Pseudomonas tolaasii]MBW1246461.1 hypothetical protein [Pseudomonas tolaasii]
MINLQSRAIRNNDDTLTRVLEQKRAVDEVPDTGSAAARASHNHKYAVIFETIIANHASDTRASKP